MRFSRQEYWNGLPCPSSGDLSDPRIKPVSLSSHALAGGFFTTYATRESHPHTYTQFFSFQFHFHYLIIILKFFKQCLKLLKQYLKTFINNILDTCLLFLHIADSLFNCFLDKYLCCFQTHSNEFEQEHADVIKGKRILLWSCSIKSTNTQTDSALVAATCKLLYMKAILETATGRIFIGGTDAEAEAPILRPPDAKN